MAKCASSYTLVHVQDGTNGKDGAYTLYQYALSTELTAPTDGWTDTMQSVTEEYPYLWIKVGKVSAGGSDSDAVWSEASLVGTDIVSVASDVAGNKSLIESMGNKIALKLVDGGVGTADEKVIAGLSIGTDSAGEGYIKLNASKTIVEGSITATEINAGAITADKLDADCLSGKTFKVQNDGAIQSADYVEGVKGFRLSADGDLDANSATLKDVTITDGTLKSNAIRTLNDEVTGSWCCAPAFPVEDGTSTTEVAVAGKSLVRSETCYFNGAEFAQWCLDNIPVNNTEFTKLDGTIYGRNVYAVRSDASQKVLLGSCAYTYNSSAAKDYEFTFTNKYVKCPFQLEFNMRHLYSTSHSATFEIYIDGVKKYTYLDHMKSKSWTYLPDSDLEFKLIDNISLTAGEHTMRFSVQYYAPSSYKWSFSFYAYQMFDFEKYYYNETAIQYKNIGSIQLRLPPVGYDDFVYDPSQKTSETGLTYLVNINSYSLPEDTETLSRVFPDTDFYATFPVSLASCKAGKGITGWTLTRYGKFAGLYEVGINQTWVESPSIKASGIYRASSVTIGGTTYEKDFTINWNASQLSVYSDDGTVSRVYTAGNYYSSWDSIVYTETAEDAGVYVSNLYPKSSESVIGSVTQPFKEAWINDIKGALTGNVTGNLTGDVTGNLTGNVNAIGTENKVYGAKFTVDVLYEGTMGGYKTYTLKKDIVKYGYEWVVVYAKSNSSGYWMGPTWFHTSLLSSFTGSSNKLVCAAQSSYWIVYFVSSSQIYINDSSTGTFRIYGIK